jgi:F0F1-type ATP synthase epsilon subunit
MTGFTIDIYTPDSVVVQGLPADSLLLESVSGQIQILPKHVQLITKIEAGTMVVVGAKKKYHFDTESGTCRILGDNVCILTKTAVKTFEE